MVLMKRSIVGVFLLLLAGGAFSARAQVVPSATKGQFSITAGALGSVFQPDYSIVNGPGTSPNRLYGVGGYVDLKFSRWLQFEAEGRWLRFNTLNNVTEESYLIGPRFPIHHFHFLRATPYVKALAGAGNGNFLTAPSLAVAYGAGVDCKLSKHIYVRAFDFEYQQWRVTPTQLWPYGASVGIGYKIF